MFNLGGHNYEADDHLEIIQNVQSEITIADLKNTIDSLCPVKIIIDGKLVWDDDFVDDFDTHMEQYEKITTSKIIVVSFGAKIVSYHHSIIYLNTVLDDGG